MEAEVEGPELLVDGRVEDPVQVKAYELLPVLVGHWQRLAFLLQVECPRLSKLLQRHLQMGKKDVS